MNHVNIRLLSAKVLYTKFLPAQFVHLLVWNGQLGVQMFFAVSGFLITSISLRRWTPLSNIRVRDFYILRFARIAPLLFLLLAVLTGLHFAHVHNYIVTARTEGWVGPCWQSSPSASMFSKPEPGIFREIGTSSGRFPLRKCSTCFSH
jgi:peptidoglycan/LPS O-acetylase OafA/YrhL